MRGVAFLYREFWECHTEKATFGQRHEGLSQAGGTRPREGIGSGPRKGLEERGVWRTGALTLAEPGACGRFGQNEDVSDFGFQRPFLAAG